MKKKKNGFTLDLLCKSIIDAHNHSFVSVTAPHGGRSVKTFRQIFVDARRVLHYANACVSRHPNMLCVSHRGLRISRNLRANCSQYYIDITGSVFGGWGGIVDDDAEIRKYVCGVY